MINSPSNQNLQLIKGNPPNPVATAFNLYRSDFVDLESEEVGDARASRDYLIGQLVSIAEKNKDFPWLYGGGKYLSFGSFARRTKIPPLDDVDLLPILHACSGNSIYLSENTYAVQIHNDATPLWKLGESGIVNSTMVLNKFKSELSALPNYQGTEINKRGEAVVVNLSSYPWSFDIVPGFAVSDGAEGIAHYLIPDGKGRWKRTDPRRDQARVTRINQLHNGNILPLLRVMKYWNKYSRHTTALGSYHLETLLLNGFASQPPLTDVKSGVITAFRILQSAVLYTCSDPKGLDRPLDADMDIIERLNFSTTAKTMADKLSNALLNEVLGFHEAAIKTWQAVFPDFPDYNA